MQKVLLPCRWEKIQTISQKILLLDGAHSAPRFEYILPKVKKIIGKKVLIFGMMNNHNPDELKLILPYFDQIIWTELPGERSVWSANNLFQKFGQGLVITDPDAAVMAAEKLGDTILVTGSLYLCGYVRNKFYLPAKILEQRTEYPI
jgi:folylpolyglutamate synthase/dihydropteroate synthase